jgi:2,5-furandicarboxylate decarboxylase 1
VTEKIQSRPRRRRKVLGDLAARGLADLGAVARHLEDAGRLARVHSAVEPRFELGGVAYRFHGEPKAVLFERVTGSPFPVLAGVYWNRCLVAGLFGLEEEQLPFHLADAVAEWQQRPLDPIVVDKAPCQEVVDGPDLTRLPISQVGLAEGGPYITAGVAVARDPDTGVRNASILRLMVTGADRMTGLMDIGRHLRDYYERAEARGQALEVTINVGVDPAVHFSSLVPASAAPMETDELGIASHLLGEPVQLVPGTAVAVEAIGSAQFVLEAEILPHLREPEGPAAEVTGYYAERDERWVLRVKAITRRRDPIWHVLIPGREVHNAVGLMAEASIFRQLVRQVPGVQGVCLIYGGCGFYHAVVQLEKTVEGLGKNAILAAFAAFPPLKQVTVVDADVDPRDPTDVEWAVATRFRPETDLLLVPGARGHELNPATEGGLGTKIGFDATAPLPPSRRFERFQVQPVDLSAYDIS